MINKTRLIDEFIELVSVPCPSKDEKQEAELIMAKLRELGLEPEMDKAHEKNRRHLRQCVGLCQGHRAECSEAAVRSAHGFSSTDNRHQGCP